MAQCDTNCWRIMNELVRRTPRLAGNIKETRAQRHHIQNHGVLPLITTVLKMAQKHYYISSLVELTR